MKITLIICLAPVAMLLALLSPVLLFIFFFFRLINRLLDIRWPEQLEPEEKPKKRKKNDLFQLNFTDK